MERVEKGIDKQTSLTPESSDTPAAVPGHIEPLPAAAAKLEEINRPAVSHQKLIDHQSISSKQYLMDLLLFNHFCVVVPLHSSPQQMVSCQIE